MYKYHRSYLIIYKYIYASRKLIDNCLIYNDNNSDSGFGNFYTKIVQYFI